MPPHPAHRTDPLRAENNDARRASIKDASWLPFVILSVLIIGAASSLAGLDYGGTLSLTLEATLFLGLAALSKPNRRNFLASSTILALCAGYFLFILNQRDFVSISDYIKAIKPWLYLTLFIIISPRFSIKSPIRNIPLNGILATVSLSYIAQYFFLGIERPAILLEGNFEVPFVTTVWLCLIALGGVRVLSWQTLSLVVITSLAQSRSGATAFIFSLLAYLTIATAMLPPKRRILALGALVLITPLAVTGLMLLFQSRNADVAIDEIDRVIFFMSFFDTMSEGSIGNLLIGHAPLSELPVKVCVELSYYLEALAGEHGECYSVIWHAFFVRFLYDFGIIGTAILLYLFYQALRSRHSPTNACLGLAPALLAGMSVGGLYNALSIAGILIFMLTNKAPTIHGH